MNGHRASKDPLSAFGSQRHFTVGRLAKIQQQNFCQLKLDIVLETGTVRAATSSSLISVSRFMCPNTRCENKGQVRILCDFEEK